MINATVTAYTGPGLLVTTGTFDGVEKFTVDTKENTLTLTYPDQSFKTFSLDGRSTFTASISGRLWTIVLS